MMTQDRRWIADIFRQLQGKHRQPLAARILIGIFVGGFGILLLYLGVRMFFEGNVHLTWFYELFVFFLLIVFASLALYYVYYFIALSYEVEETAFRAHLLPATLLWEVALDDVEAIEFNRSSNGDQIVLRKRDEGIHRVLCTPTMTRCLSELQKTIQRTHPIPPLDPVTAARLRRKRILVLIVFAIAPLPLIGYLIHQKIIISGNPAQTSPSQPSAEAHTQEFLDPAGYAVTIPDGWTLSDHTAKNQLIRGDLALGTRMGVQIRLQECNAMEFAGLVDAILRQYKKDMASHWGGVCEDVDGERSPEGMSNHTFRLERNDGQVWCLKLVILSMEGKAVILQGGSLWEDRERFIPAFDSMMSGLRTTSTNDGSNYP